MKPTHEQLEIELAETKGRLIKAIAFGPRLMGLFATLTGVLHVAKREVIQLIKDLYDVDIGLGSAHNIEERDAKALDPEYRRNNLAERDLRKLVIWRKKSFGMSDRGQRLVERITSVTETVKRHGQNALRFIQDTVANFVSGKPAPYICENLGI